MGALAALLGIGYDAWLLRGASNNSQSLVDYVNNLSKPNSPAQKQQAQVLQQLIDSFNNSFRQDCDAKAHQLNYLGQQLGGHPDITVFQSFCVGIGKP